MHLPKISVIIPVYNASKYITECLDSVLNQTFTDIEVICVNDGSTDDSLEILEKYSSEIKIINQENKGASASRNQGLKKAKGEYILFVDADDYLRKDAIKKLYTLAVEKNLDLILFKIINFDDKTHDEEIYTYFEMDLLKNRVKNNVFNYKDVKDLLFRISVTPPGKLYHRDVIKDIEFNEGLIFEDNAFFMEMIFNAQRIIFYDEYLYSRRIHENSVTSSNYEKFSDVITVYNIINKIIKEHGEYENVKHKLFNRQCRDIFHRFSQVPLEYKADFFHKIQNDFKVKRKGYEKDGTLDLANRRSREIFSRALEADSHQEFELSIEVFDLKREIKNIKKENRKLEKEIEDNSKTSLKKLFKH